MSLTEQAAAAWRGAVQTARMPMYGPGQRCVLVDTKTILEVEAELDAANKRARKKVQQQREWLEELEKAPSVVINMLEEVTEELRDLHEEAEVAERQIDDLRAELAEANQYILGFLAHRLETQRALDKQEADRD